MLFGQVRLSNEQHKVLALTSDTLLLDSLPVFPSSVKISLSDKSVIPAADFKISYNRLVFIKRPAGDSLRVSFKTLPYDLSKSIVHKDLSDTSAVRLRSDGFTGNAYVYNPYSSPQATLDFKGLDYSGSFARGISFGNNQNLVLNSSFNLQLAGKIGDDIEISGAITDSQIPIQPDGNTQQLQDFDKIYIQLKRRKTVLTAGDYELQRPQGVYFLNYLKKLQGATLSTETQIGKDQKLSVSGSVAVSRGKYGRNTFQGQEGNQGPYRLQGNDGEQFIIVLAGTERVYLDGKVLQRGQDLDYIIDYNSGEVRFTVKRLITKDSRIQIEFAYSDQNYLRSLWAGNTEWTGMKNRLKLRLNVFNEQDNKNQPTFIQLTDADRLALRAAGDNLLAASRNGIDTIAAFDPNRILYKMVDSLGYDSVLVYSVNEDSARYTASFSNVGEGNGNYVQARTAANGRVYKWVRPDALTGKKQGQYAPIVRLISPKRQQLLATGADFKINERSSVSAEIALSNKDNNTFSELDAVDDKGAAAQITYKLSPKPISTNPQASNKRPFLSGIGVLLHYETLTKYFAPIENFRPLEFQRNWNTDETKKATQHLAQAALSWQSAKNGSIGYEFALFHKDTIYNGIQHTVNSDLNAQGFHLKSSISLLSTKSSSNQSTFFRPKVDLSKTIASLNKLLIGGYWEREQNRLRDVQSDTLLKSAFYYDLFKAYAEMPSSDSSLMLKTSYIKRYDYAPNERTFSHLTEADEAALSGSWSPESWSQLNWNFTYRNLKIRDTTRTTLVPQQTYLGRLEYNLTLARGALRSSSIYELSAGQQRKTEYIYVKVNPGEGTYTWLDRNLDSIPQLNEFEIAAFGDQANYVRTAQFTDQYIRTNNILLAQTFALNPRVLWARQKHNFKAFLALFSTQSNIRIERKTLASPDVAILNPFQLSLPDTVLVSANVNIRNTVYFMRSDPVFGMEFAQTDTRERTVLASGFESRRRGELSLKARYNIGTSLTAQLTTTQGQTESGSAQFEDRRYRLQIWRLEPQVAYLYKKNFRTTVSYKWQNSRNVLGLESTRSHDISTEIAYNISGKSDLRLKFSAVKVQYVGAADTPTGYAMLQGLQRGQNFLWSLTWRKSLGKNLELNLSYDGRKTGTNPKVIHTGRAQIRAVF